MALYAGDTIRTLAGSSAELSFDEEADNVVKLEADTSAILLLNKDEKIELIQGEVFSTVNSLPEGESFEIKTPTAVAGVRGTDWVTTFKDEETSVEAIDGAPYIQGFDRTGARLGEKTVIARGQMTTVKRFERPGPPRMLSPERQRKWENMRGEVKKRAQEAIGRRKEFQGRNPRGERQGVPNNNVLSTGARKENAMAPHTVDAQRSLQSSRENNVTHNARAAQKTDRNFSQSIATQPQASHRNGGNRQSSLTNTSAQKATVSKTSYNKPSGRGVTPPASVRASGGRRR